MDKVLDLDGARAVAQRARSQGRRVVLANGCFDLLHVGHVRYLAAARGLGDLLIVGLNSDASVRRLKGPSRPINTAEACARVLLGLRSVDAVVIFQEETPAELIRALTPDLLAKGGDYRRDEIVGADFVEANGGEVLIVELVEGFSTTAIIDNARGSELPERQAAQ